MPLRDMAEALQEPIPNVRHALKKYETAGECELYYEYPKNIKTLYVTSQHWQTERGIKTKKNSYE